MVFQKSDAGLETEAFLNEFYFSSGNSSLESLIDELKPPVTQKSPIIDTEQKTATVFGKLRLSVLWYNDKKTNFSNVSRFRGCIFWMKFL